MILNEAQIEDLFAGKLVEHFIDLQPTHIERLQGGRTIRHCPVRVGKRCAVQMSIGKPASCDALVVAIDTSWATGWPVKLKRALVQEEPVRLLRTGLIVQNDKLAKDDPRSFGYTERPSEALPGEPEAIDAETLSRYSKEANERHTAFQDALDERPLLEQLAYELRRAEEVGVDAKHVHSAIQRRIRALRRQIDQRAA